MTTPSKDVPDVIDDPDESASGIPTDADRLRRLRQIVVSGLVAGAVLVPAAGLAGASGEAGVAILFLAWAVTCATGAFYGSVTLLRDDYAHRAVSRGRIAVTVILYAAAAMFAAMVASVGG